MPLFALGVVAYFYQNQSCIARPLAHGKIDTPQLTVKLEWRAIMRIALLLQQYSCQHHLVMIWFRLAFGRLVTPTGEARYAPPPENVQARTGRYPPQQVIKAFRFLAVRLALGQ